MGALLRVGYRLERAQDYVEPEPPEEEPPPPDPELPPPSGTDSWWQEHFSIAAGHELASDGLAYSDKRAVRAGVPPGTDFDSTGSGSLRITSPGVYTDRYQSGRIEIRSHNVTLIRTRVINAGAYTYGLDVPSEYGPTFLAIDSEFSGGTSIGIYASGRFVRCLNVDSNDGLRPRGSKFEWIESVSWWTTRNAPSSHSDAFQWTTNGAIVTGTHLSKSIIAAWNPTTQDQLNAAIQTGSFGGSPGPGLEQPGGCEGLVEDCFFDGATYAVRTGGAYTDLHGELVTTTRVNVEYRRNRWGLNCQNAVRDVGGNVVFDNATNLWLLTGTTRGGQAVVAGAQVRGG